MMKSFAPIAAALLVLSGCLHDGVSGHADISLEDGTWVLKELPGASADAADGEERPHLRFDSEGGRVSGFGGCNLFFGEYDASESGGLRFGPIASTRRYCPAADWETIFLRALQRTDSYRLADEELRLLNADGELIARFKAAE